jgi:hypothetical protein
MAYMGRAAQQAEANARREQANRESYNPRIKKANRATGSTTQSLLAAAKPGDNCYDPTLITAPKIFHIQSISTLFPPDGPLLFPPVI